MATTSPCVGVCRYDERHGWCAGCGRTMAEIAGWLDFDEARRAAVVTESRQRLARAAETAPRP